MRQHQPRTSNWTNSAICQLNILQELAVSRKANRPQAHKPPGPCSWTYRSQSRRWSLNGRLPSQEVRSLTEGSSRKFSARSRRHNHKKPSLSQRVARQGDGHSVGPNRTHVVPRKTSVRPGARNRCRETPLGADTQAASVHASEGLRPPLSPRTGSPARGPAAGAWRARPRC